MKPPEWRLFCFPELFWIGRKSMTEGTKIVPTKIVATTTWSLTDATGMRALSSHQRR
jgi:hypothetical protein